jgi:hypothetical protein
MGRNASNKKEPVVAGVGENRERQDCPSIDIIKAVAAEERPMDDSFRDHLNSCSACQREFRDLQAEPEWDKFYKRSSWGLYAVLFCIVCRVVFRSCHH